MGKTTKNAGTTPGGLSDLHVHVGGAVPTAVLWEILCDQGLATPFGNFQAFHQALSATGKDIRGLDDFLNRYFAVTEEIQSSPAAMAISAYQAVAKAHRRAEIGRIEVRFNPAKRLRGGVHTMDAIILAALQGLERVSLHYRVSTAAILSLGRDVPLEMNEAIADAAIRWAGRSRAGLAAGIVGIDMAGPESGRMEFKADWFKTISELYERCRVAGLRTTYHIGETADTGYEGLERVLSHIRPDRIGHGISLRLAPPNRKAALLSTLRDTGTCLEICPTVNLVTRSIKRISELGSLTRSLLRADVPFCVCTDNPYLVHTNVARELDLLVDAAGNDGAVVRKASARHAKMHAFG